MSLSTVETGSHSTPTRRAVLSMVGLPSVSVASTSGCDLFSTSPSGESGDRSGQGKGQGLPAGKEAPSLAELVKSGKLPPVAVRLPENPLTVKTVEGTGRYCELYRNIWGNSATFIRHIGEECLVWWRPETINFSFEDLVPNVAEGWEVRDGGREYSFTLRKGMKWSDGEPFTADDIVFWWNDIVMNDDLMPVKPDWIVLDNMPGDVVAVDPQTVVFQFPVPNGLLLPQLATTNGVDMCSAPAHYMKQFHTKYNKDATKDADAAGFDAWIDLFASHFDKYGGGVKDKPTLNAWIVKVPYGGQIDKVTVERNPYYWKVDEAGNQLPYADRVDFATIDDPNTRQLKALNGEFDLYLGGGDSSGPPLSSKPLFARNRDKGKYHFIDLPTAFSNTVVFYLNLSSKDAEKRKVFQDVNFRIGLSYAMNRKEMIDAVYQQQGKPYQVAPRPESQFYDEEYATQYTDYDVDRANGYLDRVLPKKDSEGRRLGPNGKPFTFTTMYAQTPTGDDWPDVLELMRDYFMNVGVDMRIKGVSTELYYTTRAANTYDASMWHGDGGLDVFITTIWYNALYGSTGWNLWFTTPDSEEALEPPEVVKQQYDLFQKINRTYDAEQRTALLKQAFQIAKEQFWYIGVNLYSEGYGVVRQDFHNVPQKMLSAWSYPTPAPTNPCQYYSDR